MAPIVRSRIVSVAPERPWAPTGRHAWVSQDEGRTGRSLIKTAAQQRENKSLKNGRTGRGQEARDAFSGKLKSVSRLCHTPQSNINNYEHQSCLFPSNTSNSFSLGDLMGIYLSHESYFSHFNCQRISKRASTQSHNTNTIMRSYTELYDPVQSITSQ